MIDVNELRKGVTYTLDGNIYRVLDYAHIKPGRGNATIRTKVRDLRSGAVVEKTFTSGDRVQDIEVDLVDVQFLYGDGDAMHFMDTLTYEQYELRRAIFGDDALYLKENTVLTLSKYDEEIVDYSLPTTVEHKLVDGEAGVAGNSATGSSKRVTTETGLQVNVPLFVNIGDTIRVDTRDGSYVTRI